jgi:hypothetical protein
LRPACASATTAVLDVFGGETAAGTEVWIYTYNATDAQHFSFDIIEEETTAKATTAKPTTAKPTTEKKTTQKVTTEKQTTEKQTTEKQTTEKKTTVKPTTEKKTTQKVTVEDASTEKQTTEKQTTEKQTTEKKTTQKATTEDTSTEEATTEEPSTGETTEAAATVGFTGTVTRRSITDIVPEDAANIKVDVRVVDADGTDVKIYSKTYADYAALDGSANIDLSSITGVEGLDAGDGKVYAAVSFDGSDTYEGNNNGVICTPYVAITIVAK